MDYTAALNDYIAHTQNQIPLRHLAKKQNIHPSTVLRRVRKIETLRDDPNVESHLRNVKKDKPRMALEDLQDIELLKSITGQDTTIVTAPNLAEAIIIKAGIKFGVVKAAQVGRLCIEGYIKVDKQSSKITQYAITSKGRTALHQALIESNKVINNQDYISKEVSKRPAPIDVLAWRRVKGSTEYYLSSWQVQAGKRLYANFYHAVNCTKGSKTTLDWMSIGTKIDISIPPFWYSSYDSGSQFEEALKYVGEGLADILLLVVCHEIGLEEAERKLQWPMRSGKLVLRIALTRLVKFYESQSPNIG